MTRRFFAPGRVNLIGEYTDLVGGLVLPVALDLGITLHGEAADGIDVRSPSADESWQRYLEAVERELAALGRPPVGIRGELTSTLPVGAGLSSSAALEVVVALALCGVADFAVDRLELAQALRRAEHAATGVPSGIMDQAASLLGREGNALLLDTGTLAYDYLPMPDGLVLAVVDSGEPRTLAASGYAERKRELEAGDERRVRHVRTENERVLAAADALRRDDRAALGRLFREGHESLRVDLEVTTPALDELVDRAYAAGAVAARMTGGGFGGAIVVLVAEENAPSFVRALPAARLVRASAGARELD